MSKIGLKLEGLLQKLGGTGLRKNWKKRWFTVSDTDFQMYYYKPSFGGTYDQMVGSIDLSQEIQVMTSPDPRTKYCFEIHTPQRVWFLLGNNEEEVNYWINGLKQLMEKKALGKTPQNNPAQNNEAPISKPNASEIFSEDEQPKITVEPSASRLEGCLSKQGGTGIVKAWKKRWFLANGTKLWYYKPSSLGSPNTYDRVAGFIDLSTVTQIKETSGTNNRFEIHTPHRIWYLLAGTPEEMKYWVTGLITLQKISQRSGDVDVNFRFPTRPISEVVSLDINDDSPLPRRISRGLSPSNASLNSMWVKEKTTLLNRSSELEKQLKNKEKEVEELKVRCTKMEDKMILWNRMAFQNWLEYAESKNNHKEEKEKEKEKEKEVVIDEDYMKQIRLLKRQLNEKSFHCQVMETEVERLTAELKELKQKMEENGQQFPNTQKQTLPEK